MRGPSVVAMAATDPSETCEYASQVAYENGALMCTTAAVYWGLSCVCEIVPPMCSRPQMQLLMKTAAATHGTILHLRPSGLDNTLQQHEVLRCIAKPCAVHADELYGYCAAKSPDMAAFLHESDIFDMLRPCESLLLTGGGHTTALYRDCAGRLFSYDSLPARVSEVKTAAALRQDLRASHRNMQQFTATHLRLRV